MLIYFFIVPLANCLKNPTNLTATIFDDDVQRPQLSTLDKYLRSQKSFAIVNGISRSSDDSVSENPGLQILKSTNYPLPYPVPKIVKQR